MPKTLEQIEKDQEELAKHIEEVKTQLAGVILNPKEIAELKAHLTDLEKRLEIVSVPPTSPGHHCHWCG